MGVEGKNGKNICTPTTKRNEKKKKLEPRSKLLMTKASRAPVAPGKGKLCFLWRRKPLLETSSNVVPPTAQELVGSLADVPGPPPPG